MAYNIEGSLLEVCNCNVLCPCWIGEDPDNGTCDSVNSYRIDRGEIDGVDVAGCTLAVITHIPGNVLKGNWKVALVVNDGASQQQFDAIISAFAGKLGGPLEDLSQLIGEVVSAEQAPITFEVNEGRGTLRIGSVVEADMEPYRGPTGEITTLNESVFTTIPGAPAWVSKASRYVRDGSKYGLNDTDLRDHNAIQGLFRFVA